MEILTFLIATAVDKHHGDMACIGIVSRCKQCIRENLVIRGQGCIPSLHIIEIQSDPLELVDAVRKNRVASYSSYAMMMSMFPMDEKAVMNLMQGAKWIECVGSYDNFFDSKRWNSEPEYRKTTPQLLIRHTIPEVVLIFRNHQTG